jgi:hypothetical protein
MRDGFTSIKQESDDKSAFERIAYLIEKHAPKLMAQGEYLTEKKKRSMERKKDIIPKRDYKSKSIKPKA